MVRKINQKMNDPNIMLLNKKLNGQKLINKVNESSINNNKNKDLKSDSFLIKNTSQINITDKDCGLFKISESIEDEEFTENGSNLSKNSKRRLKKNSDPDNIPDYKNNQIANINNIQ